MSRARSFVLVLACAAAPLGVAATACESAPAAPAPHSYDFAVEGMHCDACSTAITAKLKSLPGVQAVQVDHESGAAKVEVLGDTPTPAEILEEIDKLGYEAASVEAPAAKPDSKPNAPAS